MTTQAGISILEGSYIIRDARKRTGRNIGVGVEQGKFTVRDFYFRGKGKTWGQIDLASFNSYPEAVEYIRGLS